MGKRNRSFRNSQRKTEARAIWVEKGSGGSDAELKIDGKTIKRGKDFRFGYRHTLEDSDLIVWLKKEEDNFFN